VNVRVWQPLGLICLTLLAGSARADNWPQWRGPKNDGICAEKNLPTEWSETKNVAWKLKLPGRGSSTPAVWGDRIFLSCEDGANVVLMCIGTDGKERWKRPVGRSVRSGNRDEGYSASPSPSTDGKAVYIFTGNGDFAAFDIEGKELWRFDVQERYGKFDIQWGMHTTPLLHGDRLYLQLIHSGFTPRGSGLIVCLDKATGKEVWKSVRTSDGYAENEHSYASILLWSSGKDAYLVCHGNDYATGHSLADGKEIWRVGNLNPKDRYRRDLRFVASPVCTPELIVVPSAKNHGVVGVKPDARGEVAPGGKYEQWRLSSGTPDVSCPLVHDGIVYFSGERGDLTALDARTGKQLYKTKLHAARYRASPVYADGKVYLTARDGTFTVVQAGKEFKKLATNKLPDETAASPAIANGRIYLRGYSYLWCIEEKK
jgi:outer membrane protein assembly factor BamB